MAITLNITGYSDDLIEIDGESLAEEFPYIEGQDNLLFFSDGTVLRIEYDSDDIWRIFLIHKGSAAYVKVEAPMHDDDKSSDLVTLTGEIAWIGKGSHLEVVQTVFDVVKSV